ncbi:MAG: Extradiol ring-cleavage dioxygenase [Acidobacteria bacterium]|nr:Extradiol ring-cleavage dioxygenase [Acidobacteriota bacterium]
MYGRAAGSDLQGYDLGTMPRTPLVFISHGAPTVALETSDFTRAVSAYGTKLADARGAVVVSAHWQTRGGVHVNAVPQPPPIYDFGGFAPELYAVRYDAPGDPLLARRVATLLGGAALEERRGWDHGLWVPLKHLLPAATLPIVEVSQPIPATPHGLMQIGRALAPLRDEGIVIIGSGGIVHNLARVDLRNPQAPPEPWAEAFDRWVAERLAARDFDTLAQYQTLAPNADLAVPTPEHFDPVFVVAGASDDGDRYLSIHEGFEYGTLSMRTFAYEEGR